MECSRRGRKQKFIHILIKPPKVKSHGRRLEDNIKMDLKETGYEIVNSMHKRP
jgi:hypothetical protein